MHKEKDSPTIIDFHEGFQFILNHFTPDRLFPRTIMTKKLGYQREVFSKEEAMKFFEESEFIDCRINAFPSFMDYKGIQRYPPDFIFIDLLFHYLFIYIRIKIIVKDFLTMNLASIRS